jgi:hypothetical protein
VTTVGVDLTLYSQSSPYVINLQGSPAYDLYFIGSATIPSKFGGGQVETYGISGVNTADSFLAQYSLSGAPAAKLPAGVTIDPATFAYPENAGSIKTTNGIASPFYVAFEVVEGRDRY